MSKKYIGIMVAILYTLLSSSMLISGESTKKMAENFSLADYAGKKHSLTDYKNSKAIVIMFIATRCPVSNAYNSRMVKLFEDYSSKEVTILGINSNKQEDVKEIKAHAEENGFAFSVLKDQNNIIADKFGATLTPEIFVLSPKFEILYHGRIDDSRREDDVKSHDLRNALDEILAGKSVSVSETKAFGCTIKRVE